MPVPPTTTIPMKAAASASNRAIRPGLTPSAAIPTATATIIMASTSSITAAPRITRPETVPRAPNEASAPLVMPTEVAVNEAARKMRPSKPRPSALPAR